MRKHAACILGVLACSAAQAEAQPAIAVQWDVIAMSPQQIVFFDARPDRIDSNGERSIVSTFHVLKTPGRTPDGQQYAIYLQRTRFDCLKPEMSREFIVVHTDKWGRVFLNDTITPNVPFGRGTGTESISIMACDHFNPTEFGTSFANRDQAVAWAKHALTVE
jgi:hypothetical protein